MVSSSMKIFNNLQATLVGGVTLWEWKRTYAFMRDYETMSELARYVEDVALSFSDDDLTELLTGSYDELLANKNIREIPTDAFDENMPSTFGACIEAIGLDDLEIFQKYVASRIFNRLDLNNVKYIVFSGGGEKGKGSAGVLKALERIKPNDPNNKNVNLYDQIEAVSGASAGALIGLPVALGYTPNEVEQIVKSNNFAHFMDESQAVKSNILQRNITKRLFSAQVNAELKYLSAFSESLMRNIIDYSVKLLHENEPENDMENKRWRVEQLAHLETLPFKVIAEFCDDLIGLQDSPVKKWILEAEKEADKKHRVLSKLRNFFGKKPIDPFSGFLTERESMIFTIRRAFGEDKITAFLEDMIEDRLDKISNSDLEKILPSVTTQADEMLERNVLSLLSIMATHSFKNISFDGGHAIGTKAWKRDLIASARQNDGSLIQTSSPGWDKLSELSDVQGREMTTALNAIIQMPSHHIASIGWIANERGKSQFSNKSLIRSYISKPAYESQRSLYKRNLNFQELEILAEATPDLGFKKLHITMSRYQGWGKVLFSPVNNEKNGGPVSIKKSEIEQDRKKRNSCTGCLVGHFTGAWEFMDSHKISLSHRAELETANGDSERYQRMPLSKAVRISMSIPFGVFKAVEYEGEKYADGGIRSNLPTHPFISDEKDGQNETLICMIGDDDFYRSGKTIKGAIRAVPSLGRLWRSMKPQSMMDFKLLVRPLAIAGNWLMSEGHYFMNPNYKSLSHDDVLRTIVVRSFDVGMTDFGTSAEKTQELINKAMMSTKNALENGNDVQLSFLMDKMELLENEINQGVLRHTKAKIEKSENLLKKPRLTPGVFSKGRMKALHKEMGNNHRINKEDIAIKSARRDKTKNERFMKEGAIGI
jgi:predicted acylesterase/phospholipase RssA